MHRGIQMKILLAICVVAVAALANVGCLSETDPQTDQSEAISAVETACDAVDEPGDGTVLFCYTDHNMCCCDHVDMSTGEIFGQSCVGEE
jgi:hypothetical protein